MAGVIETRTFDAFLTSTLASYGKQLIDNIFDELPLLAYLNGKLGDAIRSRSIKRTLDGGESIVEELLYAKNSTAKSYAGAEILDVTLQDGITQARFNWKQYAVNIGITGLERRNNSGQFQIINLLKGKFQQAEMSLQDDMSVEAWGDGTLNNGKSFTGMQALISDTSTVGGVSATLNGGFWQSFVTANVGSMAAVGINKMKTAFNTVSSGKQAPDLILTTQEIYEAFENTLEPSVRRTDTKTANAGFENLTFKNRPVVYDRDCPSGEMFMLNSNFIHWNVHKDADMNIGPFQTPIDQDVTSANIIFQGNLSINNRRRFARLTDITD